jgi:hypothetical protein
MGSTVVLVFQAPSANAFQYDDVNSEIGAKQLTWDSGF